LILKEFFETKNREQRKINDLERLESRRWVNGTDCCCMTPLNAVQVRILVLLGFPSTLYQGIAGQSGELAV
jgi:hypothetical protein